MPAGEGAAGEAKIGISMPTQSLERWNRDGSYLDEQFKNAGYQTILTYSDNDTNRQVSDIQNMIADGVDLLVVAAIDGEALNTVMDEAGEAGIPIIAYDRLIMNDNVSYYVSFDNYTVGTLQGQYIVDTLDLDNACRPLQHGAHRRRPRRQQRRLLLSRAPWTSCSPTSTPASWSSSPARPTFDTVATAQPGILRPLWSVLRTSWLPTMLTALRSTCGCAPTTPPLWA